MLLRKIFIGFVSILLILDLCLISLVEIKDEILAQESLPPLIENELDNRFPDNIDIFDLLKLREIGILGQLRMFFSYSNFFLSVGFYRDNSDSVYNIVTS